MGKMAVFDKTEEEITAWSIGEENILWTYTGVQLFIKV